LTLVLGCTGVSFTPESTDDGAVDTGVAGGDTTADSPQSEDGAFDTYTPPTPAVACDALVDAFCGQLETCAPYYVALDYGEVGRCKARAIMGCTRIFEATGTSLTPERMVSCATDLKTSACVDFLSSKLPASCAPLPGTRADGSPCGDDSQCVSTFCGKRATEVCGLCAKPLKAGTACGPDDKCDRGLICSPAKKCSIARSEGQTCIANTQPCEVTLSCTSGTCVKAATAAQKCSASGSATPICDETKGLICNSFSGNICQAKKTAPAKSPCGVVGADFVECAAGGHCDIQSGFTGICFAAADDGGACDLASGPLCRKPAVCSKGSCTLPDATSCK
jgi:hypothetical protein